MQDKNAKPRRLGGPGRYRPPRGAAKRESAPSHHGADPLDELPLIWGMHSVEAALANPERRIVRAWLTENAAHRMAAALAQRNVTVEGVSPKDLDRRLGAETVHQGALLEVEPLPDVDLRALAETAASRGPLIVLDQVTDPHNVGAILRSGAVFGASGLVMTARHSAPLGGVLAKAASGALELIPIALVQNLSRAIAELGECGVATIGLDGEAHALLEDAPLAGPVALVLGAEGKGLRRLTRDTCQQVCSISTSGQIASLNVSNAAAVALHLVAMRRRQG